MSAKETPIAVFRADAAPAIGAGHVMRCLTLANALREQGWHCAFACNREARETAPALAGSGFDILDCEATADPVKLTEGWPGGCDQLVVDHYGLDAGLEAACRGWSRHILVIDDLGDRRHDCDLLVDPTPDRSPGEYDPRVPETCGVLTGPDYAFVRPAFAMQNEKKPEPGPDIKRIFVGLGATDPDNATVRILAGLETVGAEIDVVLGAGAQNLDSVQRKVDLFGGRARLHTDLGPDELAHLMGQADLTIGAGGSSAWERCASGLPSLIVVIVENQRAVADSLARHGAGIVLGDLETLAPRDVAAAVKGLEDEPVRLLQMSKSAAALCDGLGAERVAAMIAGKNPGNKSRIALRAVARADSDTLLAWQQAPGARRYAHNPAPPSTEEHRAWFQAQRTGPDSRLFIITCDGSPAGIIRLDQGEPSNSLVVSILVAGEFQKYGIGLSALSMAHGMWPAATFLASVLPGNEASHRLFRTAGYAPEDGPYYNYVRRSHDGSEQRA